MRPANCRKLWLNTPCPLSRRMIAGSKVTPSSAAEIACRDMPCAAASYLKASSQTAKLGPVLRQRGAAAAGSASNAPASMTAANPRVFAFIVAIRRDSIGAQSAIADSPFG
jgi:hypothetical protein